MINQPETIKGKLPPQAIKLERAVLGAMMLDSRALDDALELIRLPDVFYKENHKKIFAAILMLSSKSVAVDMLTVIDQLKTSGDLVDVGGEITLVELTSGMGSGAHTAHHCMILLQQFIKRRIIAVSSLMTEAAYDETTDSLDLMDQFERELTSLSEIISKGKRAMTWPEALRAVAERVEFLTNNESDLTGVTIGLTKLNKHFGGWQPTDFIVIGARPGMGKTAFTVNNMIEAAKSGVAVGFVTMEMSDIQLAIRAVAVNSNYHMKQLNQTGFEKKEYFQGLNATIAEMEKYPIYIDDRPSLNISEIKRTARTMKRKHNIGLLIVDYIQLASGHKDIRIRTGETSRGLKHIAKELEIPVVGLAQLSREVEKTATKRPALHHLKEAGDIEQDADIVSFIYRPGYYGFEPDQELLNPNENTEFIVAKNRHGGLGTVGIYFQDNKTKFMDSDPTAGTPF